MTQPLVWPAAPRLVTCVVGAGPAGLMFCLLAGIHRQRMADPSGWPIVLVDKRQTYERSHRLRIDPQPYRITQQQIDDPRFDELISFLDDADFHPAANRLEEKLHELVSSLGIEKRRVTIGSGVAETDLAALRSLLIDEGVMSVRSPLTVVAADSVSSATRSLVQGNSVSVDRIHQTVARLRIEGEGLPNKLEPVRQLKLAKLLGSALDYRSNPNGYAEVDLFLSPEEHAAVVALGARPADPVALSPEILERLDARLFSSVVQHLESKLGAGPAKVFVQSTFRLEHRYQETVAFGFPDDQMHVFLVGDAAVSLPFFRGMACLAQCVDALAVVHSELTAGLPSAAALAEATGRYNDQVAAIRSAEVAIVEKRARAIRVARELVRVSSMAPFPMQTWLLSERRTDRTAGWFSARVGLTIALVTVAAIVAIASPAIGVLGLACLPLQALAGALYRSDLENQPNPWIALVCRLQVAALTVSGLVIAVVDPYDSGILIRLGAAVGWFVLGLVFVAGMYAAEARLSRGVAARSAKPGLEPLGGPNGGGD